MRDNTHTHRHGDRRDEARAALGLFPPVNSQDLDITGGQRRGGSRGLSHGDGRRRRRWRSAAEEESGAPGIVLEDLLLSHFVLGRFRLRRREDADCGGRRRARARTHTHARNFNTKSVSVCVCVCYLHLYVPGMCRNDPPPPSISPSRALRGVSEWTQVYRLLARCSFVVGARTERKQKVLFFDFILLISSLIAHRSSVSPSGMLRSLSRAQLPGL